MSRQCYRRYIRDARIPLKDCFVRTLLGSLNSEDEKSKILGISHLDYVIFYMNASDELPILIRATRYSVKNHTIPDRFNASTVYTTSKTFLGEGRTVFVDHGKDYSENLVEVSDISIFYICTTKNLFCRSIHLHSSAQL